MSTRTVLEALDCVARGEVFVSRETASRILRCLMRNGDDIRTSGTDALTDREMIVFQMLGEGLLVDQIADRLKLNRKTVEAYRRGAKEKLGHQSIAELVHHGHTWFAKHI